MSEPEYVDTCGIYLISTVFVEGVFETAVFGQSSWDDLLMLRASTPDGAAINHNKALAFAAQRAILEGEKV